MTPNPAPLSGFTQQEISLIEFTLHPDQISSLIYGRTFHDVLRSSLASRLLFATDQMKDGFLAFAMAMSNNKNVSLGQNVNISHEQRGSRALQVLGNLTSPSIEDARTALVLALALITYNDLMVGAPALPITRSALLLAAPWRNQLVGMTTEDTEASVICILFNEMFECLVLGQIPVFRYDPLPGNTIVDRYYGICHEVLPYLHEICLLFTLVKKGTISSEDRAARMKQLTRSIDQWVPETALEKRQGIIKDEIEKQHFLLQARCFKTTIQLLILQGHRSPVTDMLASSKASQLESEIFHASYQGIGRPNYLLFPYFVSCLELYRFEMEESNTILDTMDRISNGIAPKSCESMLAGLKHILQNRQKYPDLTWFECVEDGLTLAMGP